MVYTSDLRSDAVRLEGSSPSLPTMKIDLWTKEKLMKGADPIFLKGHKKIGILLFHGWSSTPQEFNPDYVPSTAKYLNSLGYTVYVPLRIGHGTKPEDFNGLHWEDWIEDAKKHFDLFAKEVDGVVVGGMSMGGQLALKIATERPVLGVIPMGTPVFMNMDPLFRVWAWVNRNSEKMIHKRYFAKDRDIAMKKVHYTEYPAYHLYENAKASWEIRKVVPRVKVPILIMHTSEDSVVDPMSAKYLLKRVGSNDKQLVWVKDSYHTFTTDHNATMASKAMGDFIDRISK